MLKAALPSFKQSKGEQRHDKRGSRREQRRLSRGRASHDQNGGNDRAENDEQKHQRKTAK
jgi:hypothetical protein